MDDKTLYDSVVLTLDTDWAPDFVIEFAMDRLLQAGVAATWFITHRSAAIERLESYPQQFELGIHPNFNRGSTHGEDPTSVFRHCLSLVPNAKSHRSHGLVTSSWHLHYLLTQTEIERDVSTLMPRAQSLQPIIYEQGGRHLLRIPYFFDDYYEQGLAEPCWDAYSMIRLGSGLKVFNFHPIHLYLNGRTLAQYESMKLKVDDFRGSSPDDLRPFRRAGTGPLSLFDELIEMVACCGKGRRIVDLEPELRSVSVA